jgi:diguanylate cyclase (GGDEF)-like protein
MAPAWARAPLEGDPPLTRHTPDVDAYPQNFALAQDNQSIVYVGNYDGVLIFDGERWELLRLPNRDLARALAFDGTDRVYVGGHDQFGYIRRDMTGHEQFHDLTPVFQPLLRDGETFEDIWDIHIAREGVFFRALRHLFLYEPASGATRLWRHEGRFGGIVQSGDSVVLQFRGEGLKQYKGGEWQLLPGSEPLHELAWDFLRLPDGGLVGLAADGRWRVYRNGRVSNFPVPSTFPPSSSISAGTELADGTLVMVSGDGMAYTLDPRTGAHRHFRLDTGFLTEVIPARGGGLLIAAEDRLLHLEWPAPWTALGETYGMNSSLVSMVRWGERWHALTSSGVFALEPGADGPRFQPLDWTGAEAWDLLPLDAGHALLAESYDLVLVTGRQARTLTHGALYPRLLRRALGDPNVVLVGLEPGIAIARRAGGDWRIALEDHTLSDLETTSMVESEPRVLWLGSDRGGVWRIRFTPGYGAIEETRRFGPGEGITYGEPPGGAVTTLADGTLVATTHAGVFRWNGDRFISFDLDGLDVVRDKGEWVELALAPDGTRWAFSHKNVYREMGGGWRREEIGGVRRGAIESITFDETGAPLFSSTRAVLRFDPAAPAPAGDGVPMVQVRAVERRDARGGVEALPFAGALSLPDGDFGLRIRFALPEYRQPGATRYATRLAGLEPHLSAWSEANTLQYPRLPPGNYRLEVMARDSLGRDSRSTPLELNILPAWYATGAARALWLMLTIVALAALTLGTVRWRTVWLERLVAERTAELRAANERLDAMAHLDGLTGVPNRRELDRHLEKAWAQCEREGRELAVLALDVDGFKRYNDLHGHQSGDEMLVRLVKEASACLNRRADLLARYGGDEFFVVRTGENLAGARDLGETLRRRIEVAALGATVSVGAATRSPKNGGQVRDLVRAADAALYAAKSAGRNRVAA